MTKLVFCAGLTATFLATAQAQVLTQRSSDLNFNYVYGAGGTVFQDTHTDAGTSVVSSGSHSISHSDQAQGILNGNPWSAGMAANVQHQFQVTGPLDNFRRIQASGSSYLSSHAASPGLSSAWSSSPGNRLIHYFTLSEATDYSLKGNIAFSNGVSTQTTVSLQRWDGIVWQHTYATWMHLPGGQGAFETSGTLNPGEYRVFSGLSMNVSSNVTHQASYDYDFQVVPEPATLALALPALLALNRKRKKKA